LKELLEEKHVLVLYYLLMSWWLSCQRDFTGKQQIQSKEKRSDDKPALITDSTDRISSDQVNIDRLMVASDLDLALKYGPGTYRKRLKSW
jgi:preprotein translocase subunit SecF